MLQAEQFYTNQEGDKCGLYINDWWAGLAMNGRIRDIGQKCLQSPNKPLTHVSKRETYEHLVPSTRSIIVLL